MASQHETPDRTYMKEVQAKRATAKHLGMEMMARWNHVELSMPLFHELAVMGHEYENDFTFLIEVNGKIFHVEISEEE